jgi:hypothetical protein
VNVSPKGTDGTFRVLGPTTVAYLDLVGERCRDGRPPPRERPHRLHVLRLRGTPKILRLHGRGRAVGPDDPKFARPPRRLRPDREHRNLARSVVVVEVERIADSCGFGVPLMDFIGKPRPRAPWAEQQAAKHGPRWKAAYIGAKNAPASTAYPASMPLPTNQGP